MKLKQIRYQNVRRLVAEAGNLKEFADKLGKAPAQCSSFAGINPRKGIGDAVAADIERAFGLPSGWLDENRSPTTAQSAGESGISFDSYSALIELGKELKDFTEREWAEIQAYARIIRIRRCGQKD